MNPLAWSAAGIIAIFAIWLSRRMRRRGTDSLVASAVLFLGLGAAAFTALTSFSGDEPVRTQVFKFAAVTTSLTASIVCGLIALGRSRKEQRPGLVALVLTAGFGATLQWTVICHRLESLTAIANAGPRMMGQEPSAGASGLAGLAADSKPVEAKKEITAPVKVSPVLGQTMRDFFGAKTPQPQVAATTLDEENFRFTPPAGAWEVLEAKKFNPLACYAMARFREQLMFVIICEKLPEEMMPDLQIIGKFATSHLNAIGTPKLLREATFTHRGMKGLRMEHEVSRGFSSTLTIHQILVNRGYAWQIIFSGPNRDAANVRKLADQMLEGFQVLDPNRSATSTAIEKIEPKYTSPLGWSIDLSGEKVATWNRKWPELAKEYPDVDFAILNTTGNLGVLARSAWLPEPVGELEPLANTFLEHFGAQLESPAIVKREPITQGRVTGIAVHFERKISPSEHYRYQARILKDGNRVWLVCGFGMDDEKATTEKVHSALNCVSIQEPPEGAASLPPAKGLSGLCNGIALHFERRGDLESSLRWLKHANAAPNSDPTILLNLMIIANRAGRAAEALPIYEKLSANFPGNVKLRAEAARLASSAGRRDEAVKLLNALFESGHRNDEDLSSLIAIHLLAKDAKAGIEAFDRYADQKNAPPMRRLRALLLTGLGKTDEAITDLIALRKDEPGNALNLYRLADLFADAGRHEEIVAMTNEFLAKNPGDVEALHYQGVAQLRLKRNEEAKKSFESALKIQPANEEIKDLLAHASAMLGQGDNSQIKTPIEPVPIPAELLKIPADAPETYVAGFNAYYRFSARAIAIEKARGDRVKVRTTEHRIVKVVDREGAEAFNSLSFTFNPRGEDFYVNSLIVRDEKGETIGTGKVDDYYVLDQSDAVMATNDRAVNVPVPGLRPGCTIEYVATRMETLAPGEAPFVKSALSQVLPVLRSAVVLHDPDGIVSADASEGIKPARKGSATFWSVERPVPFAFEPLMAPWHTFQPMVTIGDPKASWSRVGREYLESIQAVLEADTSLKEVAQRIAGGMKSDAEKVSALARYVQEELTYKAIEFGRRARIPQPISTIVKNRYGDCKDHALLLHQLLRAAGVSSHVTLINSGGWLRREFPSLDQFDHAIVFVPSVAGGLFVDCTQKSCAFDASPSDFNGYEALVLDPKSPALVKVGGSARAKLKLERQITMINDGDVEVRETVTALDDFATSLRDSLRFRDVESRRRGIEFMLKRAEPSLELRNVEIDHLTEPGKPLVFKLVSSVRRKAQEIGGQYVVHVPAAWEHVYLEGHPVQQRKTPFELRVATEIDSVVRVQTPKGWRASTKAAGPEAPSSLKHASAETRVEMKDGDVARHTRVRLKPGNFPAAGYAKFVQEMEALKSLYSPDIGFEKL